MTDFLEEYTRRIVSHNPITLQELRAGELVRFRYHNKPRIVMIVNPSYLEKLHGISLELVEPKLFDKLIKATAITVFTQNRNTAAFQLYENLKPILKTRDIYRTYNIYEIGVMEQIHLKVQETSKDAT